MSLLNPDGKTMGLYFPPGLPERGGSCAFASMRCLVNCLSYLSHNTITDYTEDVFKTKTPKEIAAIIKKELGRGKPPLIEWFCWGDCMPNMTDKVLAVMKALSAMGFVQCGFTRNKLLWTECSGLTNIRMGYTTEDFDEIDGLAKSGLVAYPNYDTGETRLYWGTHKAELPSALCGSSFMSDRATGISYEADCSVCYARKRGCFTDFVYKKVTR